MDLRAILMGVGFALMWASAFTSTRMIVTEAPPLMALALRFAISGGIGIAIASFMGESWRALSRAQWRAVVVLGLCQNALYLGLNWIAMQWIEAGLASIIAASMPLMVAFLGWIWLGERLRPMGILGLVLGLVGVGIIMGARLQGGSDPIGIAMGFVAALALAVATLTVRGASGGGNVMMVVGMQMLVGAGALALIAPFVETWDVAITPRLVGAFAYTVIVPGLLATWIWFLLVGRIGAVRAATFHFLSPFFGVTIAALLLGESLGAGDVLGVAIIMVGILAVQMSRQPAPVRKRPPPA
ncbi:DMT family transporter [Paracoccus sp. 1_MG-2023]|uniref:DMT family transporter n=1 Tax=unclassified Paracoccus (in: a-proteobacteria) TaxID=2688777 RepID=UPI001C08BCE8|nr:MULTISPECIES: DMT family transporter [unclassified Paracoccus (in: a-proteobacteria)]MBU2957275.1 DMT family transporter [Paracoccus sp. C2R09]MDO6669162.1 DMT family transporter [Paracoccus sp. 1_MG-2023]